MRVQTNAKLALIIPVEQEARARGKCTHREYRVATPRLEGIVDLVVTDGLEKIAYGALTSLDLVHWNLMMARALNAKELRLIFPNRRLAHDAQQRVEELRASGKAGSLSVLCLTVEAAVELLKNSNGTNVESRFPSSLTGQMPPQTPNSRTIATRRDSPCKSAGTTSSR
jgi:hypothetical protein